MRLSRLCDRDPSCINSKIKDLIQEKNIAKKYYFQNKDIQLFRRFQCMQNLITATTEKSKQQFSPRISNKLMDPTIIPKAYWSILKTFINKKILCIPPIYHNNNYITNFKENAQIFNNFFAKQCSLVENLLTNFLRIPLKEQITYFQLSLLLKMILQKSLQILIRITPMALT